MVVDSRVVYKIDDDLDLTHAALTEPLACCVHSIGNGNIQLGDDVVVIGAGIMGCFHIQLAKMRGARVIACEIDPHRLEFARKFGADMLINSNDDDPVETIKTLTRGRGADVTFCTASHVSLANQAVKMTGKLGRCVLYSSFHPKSPIELDVNHVHYSEMIITGSVSPATRDFLMATRLLSNKLLDPSEMISEVLPYEQLENAINRAIDPKTYRVLVTMD